MRKNNRALYNTKEFRDEVIGKTQWLDSIYPDQKIPIRIRIMVEQMGLSGDTFPRCPSCGKPVGYDKARHSKLLKFCSNACSSNRDYLPKEIVDKLSSYEWVYEQRVLKQKSYELIAQELAISTIPVRKWVDRHNLPLFKLNESQSQTLAYLKDKDWLTKKYDEGLKIHEIADEIGSSAASVSRWFQHHEIKTRNPNEYERSIKKSSKDEDEIFSFVQTLTPDVKQGDRIILQGKEIDILIPSCNLGIEYNGLFSHIYRPFEEGETRQKGRQYYLQKTILAEEKGITLLHFFSDEWYQKKDIVKSMIRHRLGRTETIIGARKCSIALIDPLNKSHFFNQNHIQGNAPSSINIGLYYDDVLVSAMSFGKAKRNKNYTWELLRFASKINVSVIGGFSKLLKYFEQSYSGSIISYSDRRFSTGEVYSKNGFTLSHIIPPGYDYVDEKYSSRKHRAQFMKKRIAPGDPRPEWQIMLERGYNRIWNCGHMAWTKETPPKRG